MRRLAVVVCVVALVLAVVASSCAAPQVSPEKEIPVGVAGLLTGPVASTGVPVTEGEIDGLKWVNDYAGGINGTPIKVIWEDTACLAARCIPIHRRFVEKGVVVEVHMLSSGLELLLPSLQKDKIPAIWPNMVTQRMLSQAPQWEFGCGPGFGVEFATFSKWVVQNWKESRPPRIGLFIYDHASGWDCLSGSEHLPAGVEYVGHEVLPFLGAIDTTVEVLRLMGKDPDWIFCQPCGGTAVTLAMDMHRLDVQAKGTKLCASISFMDEVMIEILGEAAENWYYSTVFSDPHTEADIPGMKDIFDSAKQYRDIEPKDMAGHYMKGWVGSAVVVAEALRLAVEKVGLENLDGSAVRDALVSIRSLDSKGLTPPITITDDKPFYVDGLKYYQVRQGLFHSTSKVVSPAYYMTPE